MLKPRLETKSSIPLIGMHATFISGLAPDTNAPQVIGPLWERFNARRGSLPARHPEVSYGYLCYGEAPNPEREDEFNYLAGIEVDPEAPVPEGMEAVAIPEGLYAVFEHVGPIWTFQETLRQIYSAWLPASDYACSGLGDVERYDERWSPDGEDSVFEYWVGVEPAPQAS